MERYELVGEQCNLQVKQVGIVFTSQRNFFTFSFLETCIPFVLFILNFYSFMFEKDLDRGTVYLL